MGKNTLGHPHIGRCIEMNCFGTTNITMGWVKYMPVRVLI